MRKGEKLAGPRRKSKVDEGNTNDIDLSYVGAIFTPDMSYSTSRTKQYIAIDICWIHMYRKHFVQYLLYSWKLLRGILMFKWTAMPEKCVNYFIVILLWKHLGTHLCLLLNAVVTWIIIVIVSTRGATCHFRCVSTSHNEANVYHYIKKLIIIRLHVFFCLSAGADDGNKGKLLLYKLTVKTGDRSYAGTDARVFIKMTGKNGITQEVELKNSNHKDPFEKGKTDTFQVMVILSMGFLLERFMQMLYHVWWFQEMFMCIKKLSNCFGVDSLKCSHK